MSLGSGSTLRHFKILAKLGAGGMGEVWQAEDTRLHRQVAIKVLPEAFTADPERLARFRREAELLAALEHSNIASLYEIGEEDGVQFLAMQLVEGEDLAERITRGPLPREEAVTIALQVAEALEAAHDKGIVHRDLKPGNIKVTPAAHEHPHRVTILDFGLAKALATGSEIQPATETDAGSETSRPTATLRQADLPSPLAAATEAGVIMGTVAYMSPEQAWGHPVDHRCDIWAFGCLLYEMLSGRPLFIGDSVAAVLTAIRHGEIRLDALPADTPENLLWVLRRCLVRDPRDRLHHIADARLELRDPAPPIEPAGPDRVRFLLPTLVALVALLAAALAFRGGQDTDPAAASSPLLRASISLPSQLKLEADVFGPRPPALSPDGRRLVYIAAYRGFTERSGAQVGFLYELATARTIELRAQYNLFDFPSWAPDGRGVVAFGREDLRRFDLAALESPTNLTEVVRGRGVAWLEDDTILFARSPSGGLLRMPAAGGTPVPVTEVAADGPIDSHRFPVALPGDRFLYLAHRRGAERHEIRLAELEGGDARVLLEVEAGLGWADGYLFYVDGGTLMAHPFDPASGRLTDPARPLVQAVAAVASEGMGCFSVSPAGPLAFVERDSGGGTQLMRVGRRGELVELLGRPGEQAGIHLSPDGRRVAKHLRRVNAGFFDVAIHDLERDVVERLTSGEVNHFGPIWSPDGGKLLYSRVEAGDGKTTLVEIDLDTAGEREIATSPVPIFCSSWSPDAATVLCDRSEVSRRDVLAVSVATGEIELLIADGLFERHAQVSPDGRWLLYAGFPDLGSSAEVFLTTYPRPGRRWQVSRGGGLGPRWRGDGGEIFYRSGGTLMAVPVRLDGRVPELGVPEELFSGDLANAPGYDFDVDAAGETFVIHQTIDTSRLTVISDWRRLLDPS